MRFFLGLVLLLGGGALRCEIRDVLKSSEIDAMFARTTQDRALDERPSYAIWLKVHDGKPGPYELHRGADDILWVRRGKATLLLGGELTGPRETSPGDFVGRGIQGARQHEAGAGDVIHLPRNTAHRIDPGSGRFEYVVVRVFPTGGNLPPRQGFLAPRRMPDVLKKSEIDDTFAKYDANQPIHAALNYTMNYVIYSGRSGPYEAHRGCVDIYFLQVGTGVAHLGGEITNAKEETPGEIRGDAVTGSRTYDIGPGDMVVIPRNGVHHMIPTSPKLGYLLMKVWAE